MLRERARARFVELNALRVGPRLRCFGNRNRRKFFLFESKQPHRNARRQSPTAAQRKFRFDARMRTAGGHRPQPIPAPRECLMTWERDNFGNAATDWRIAAHQRRSFRIKRENLTGAVYTQHCHAGEIKGRPLERTFNSCLTQRNDG